MKKVSLIILNFKVKENALECIKSVKSNDYPSQIILVDNASEDGIGKDAAKIKGIKFIQNNKNLGYTGGNNIGIKKAVKDGADYIFIINPDTIIDKGCIRHLVEAAERNGAGVVGPKIYFDDKKTLWHAGGIMDMLNVIGSHRGVDQKDRGQFENEEEVDFVSGAAILVKRDVFNSIGFFDERYFLYYEDADFCLRAKIAGFKIMYIPKAKVIHENAKSVGLGSPLQDYYITRNRLLYASKFLPLRTRLALFREALRNLGNPMRRLALCDFLIGRFGKGSVW